MRFLNALVLEKLRRKKWQSIGIIMVLWISISFAIMSQALITSLQQTNQKQRENLYGEWSYRVTGDRNDFDKTAQRLKEVDYYGTMGILGRIQGVYGLGTLDENMKTAGRLLLTDGKWPEGESEIVLTEDSLKSLGYEDKLGQELVLSVEMTSVEGETITVDRTFVLCGVLEEYADLWINGTGKSYVEAVVTEKAVEDLCAEAGMPCEQEQQYFLVLNAEVMSDTEKMESLDKEITRVLSEMREISGSQPVFEKNQPLFLGELEQLESDLYIKLIAAVCLAAMVGTYLLRIQEEIRYCAVLRSIGIEALQLAEFGALECVYMLFPAVVLGVPTGAGLTWCGMKILQTGIDEVCLRIPYGAILRLLFIWSAITLLARGMITLLALRVPLRGQLQLGVVSRKIFHQAKNIFIIAVLSIGCYMVLNGTIGRREAVVDMVKYESNPHYNIRAGTISNEGEYLPFPVNDKDIHTIRNMREVDGTLSYSYADIGIAIEGLPDRSAQMVIVNAEELEKWNAVLNLSAKEQEKFSRGEMGIMCFPSEEIASTHLYLDRAYLLPGETLENRVYPDIHEPVELTFYNVDHEIVARAAVPVKVEYLSYEADYAFKGVELHSAYTILCSDQMIEDLLEQSQEAVVWTPPYQEGDSDEIKWSVISYGEGQGVGYRYVQIWANSFADFERLDVKLAEFCKSQGYELENKRVENMALVQEQLQKVVRILAVGVCEGLLAILLYVGIIALEVQAQRNYYRQLWIMGMSRRGIFWREARRTAIHAILATVAGTGFFFYEKLKLIILQVEYIHAMEEYAEPLEFGYSQAWEHLVSIWRFCEIQFSMIGYVGLGFVVFVLLISILIKRKLWKGDMTL